MKKKCFPFRLLTRNHQKDANKNNVTIRITIKKSTDWNVRTKYRMLFEVFE